MVNAIGGNTVDMEKIQVHPTGLLDPKEPDAKVKFLAAEALRGVGGILLDNEGNRFCDELGHRDYVTGLMWKVNKPPYRLVLNGAAGREIEWHCKHYMGRGLMKRFANGSELAAEMGIPVKKLEETMKKYNEYSKNNNDPFGKKYFQNLPLDMKDEFFVSIVTPVVHFCMGGVEITPDSEIIGPKGPISGLFSAGELCGGVHGANRLGGSSLLACVVYGRVAGDTAARYLFNQILDDQTSLARSGTRRASTLGNQISSGGFQTRINVDPVQRRLQLDIAWDESNSGTASSPSPFSAAPSSSPAPSVPGPSSAPTPSSPAPKASVDKNKEYTPEEVAKHNSEKDCWVIVNGQVLDVTSFLKDHPGGKKAILIYAGKDASSEFNMLHKPDVVDKYAPDSVIGKVKGVPKAKL
jgi:cytochrome b involved in lipid metabolism